MSPEAYELQDGRFIQVWLGTSAADAVAIVAPAVPAGKVRTYLTGSYYPSVAETKVVQWVILAGGINHAVGRPESILLSGAAPAAFFPLTTEGMEIKLFPGEVLVMYRDSATAGSTMTIGFRFIETDLPYYSYEDPLNKVVRSAQKHGSVYRATGGVSVGAGAREITREGRERGGRPEPI